VSYILDALKKAEDERRRGIAPDITTVQDTASVQGSSVRSVWTYLMLAVLLLNAGVLVWWLGPWNMKRTGKAVPRTEAGRTFATAEIGDMSGRGPDVASPAEKTEPGPADKAAVDRNAEKTPPSREIRTVRKKVVASPAKEPGTKESVARKMEAGPAIEEKADARSGPLPSPDRNRIYAVNQLPPSVRQDLPDLKMSLHYFTDDPSSRLVSIGGETLREGQEVAPGLRIDKITADGAVFDYQHYHFRIGIKQK
jgi:general secretion pathway protein B